MLKLQRRILQEVDAAQDMSEALQIVVKRVREALETQACTIYLKDAKQHDYVLMATDGLKVNPDDPIRVQPGQGLVGLVVQRGEPLNLESAPSHPDFFFHPDSGEERLHAYLGVPISYNRQVLGVLTVQEEEQRRFDVAEEALLVTMAAQLAGVVAKASAQVGVDSSSDTAGLHEQISAQVLKGLGSVPGVAIGTAVVVYPPANLKAVPDKTVEDIATEIALFEEALVATRDEVKVLKERIATHLPEQEQTLFDAYLAMLSGHSLGNEVVSEIRAGNWAQGALRKVIKGHISAFEAMEDDYIRERITDIKDIGRRVLSHLQAGQKKVAQYPEQTILIGDEVTAAALAEVPEGHLAGVVSGSGSSNSHVAILARALGVPTAMSVANITLSEAEGQEVIIDGYHGQVYIAPSEKLRRQFLALAKQEEELDADLEALRDMPAETPDGHCVALCVNTGLAADAGLSLTVGAEGVGLYRTEMAFIARDHFPTEEQQKVIYKQLLAAFAPRPVIMRTLDVGGDKELPYLPIQEDNPFLGWRGIRITLDHPDIMLVQMRAMLRASEGYPNLRIMFPMISHVSELDEALRFLRQAHSEVIEEGCQVNMPLVGVMIEVPAAVYQARLLARRVDFLSIGSNDLTQYILAVDRNNSRVANLYDALHPAVLMALQEVVTCAHAENKQVSICGEMAGDPLAAILLLGMGFDALSMNSASLPRIRWVIRNFTLVHAKELLQQVLHMDNPLMIRRHLETVLDQAGLGGLIRAGR